MLYSNFGYQNLFDQFYSKKSFMKYFTLENGDKMPSLGLGTWKSAKGEVYNAVRMAIETGYRHFDCAYLYGNEKEIGDAFSDSLKAGDVKREDLWITSKLWNNRHRKEQVKPAFDITLQDLQCGYLDLYLIHWPVVVVDEIAFPENGSHLVSLNKTTLTETWEGMIELKASGLTRHIGVSNFSAKKILKIWEDTGVKPEVDQVEMHPYMQQKPLKSFTDQHNIILTAYAPLGSADRPASRISLGDPILFNDHVINALAKERGISAAQVMLAWAVNNGVSVIPKSVRKERLNENLLASDIEFNKEEMERLGAIDLHNRYIKGDFWCLPGSDYTLENLWDEAI
jgi:alcohol dehydrogenase (NADP+)